MRAIGMISILVKYTYFFKLKIYYLLTRASTLVYMRMRPGEATSVACYNVTSPRMITCKLPRKQVLSLRCTWVHMYTISCQLLAKAILSPSILTNLVSAPTPVGHCATEMEGWILFFKSTLLSFITMATRFMVTLASRDPNPEPQLQELCWQTG